MLLSARCRRMSALPTSLKSESLKLNQSDEPRTSLAQVRLSIIMATALVVAGSWCHAEGTPALLNYQGRLTGAAGAPMPPGSYTIQFRLWDSPTATGADDLVWAQSQNVAIQSNGMFNVILGSPGPRRLPELRPR